MRNILAYCFLWSSLILCKHGHCLEGYLLPGLDDSITKSPTQLYEYAESKLIEDFHYVVDNSGIRQFNGIPDSLLQYETAVKSSFLRYKQEYLRDSMNEGIEKLVTRTKIKYEQLAEVFKVEHPNYYNLRYKNFFDTIINYSKRTAEWRIYIGIHHG